MSLQQQFGYQDQEERSLNSLDSNPAFPLLPPSSRSRSRANPLDSDRQLLQDLVSFYLSSPPSPSSSSSFLDVDFPLDYGEDSVSHVSASKQQDEAKKKVQKEYDALSGLDGERTPMSRPPQLVSVLCVSSGVLQSALCRDWPCSLITTAWT